MNGRSFKTLTIFFIFTFVFPIAQLTTNHVFATTQETVDETLVEAFEKNNHWNLYQKEEPHLSQDIPETFQEFSFAAKTFRTTTDQLVLINFTSTIATTEVLVRVPEQGKILKSEFSQGESLHHSHGEYWLIKTPLPQTLFEVTVLFEQSGNYFLTVGHDADHFYLEVEDEATAIDQSVSEKDYLEETESERIDEERTEFVQSEVAKEENLSIPDSIIAEEELRIYEETLDPETRSQSFVNNWSQFRSAWNNSGTSIIVFAKSIEYSSSILGSNLNARNSPILIEGIGKVLHFGSSNNNLVLNGIANLTVTNLGIEGGSTSLAHIRHLGSGMVQATGLFSILTRNSTVIEAQNIVLNNNFLLTSASSSAISLVRNGTLTINNPSTRSYIATTVPGQKPIASTVSSRIIINNVTRMTMGEVSSGGSISPRSSWSQVNATLTGVNGSQVLSSSSDQGDFEERYTQLFSERWYNGLIFNGTNAEFVPPIQTGTVTTTYTDVEGNKLAPSEVLSGTVGEQYSTQSKELENWSLIEEPANANGIFTREPITVAYIYERTHQLSLQASPASGGTPEAESVQLIAGERTVIRANPNQAYNFVRWEIISGEGSVIEDPFNIVTALTIGNNDATIRAVYETKVVSPVDPLDPEVDALPENPPQIPESGGLLSIDFVSQFNFGSQTISVHDQTYYAKPQRLLNEDGTINENEERPNYVQISDRRPENVRNGWTLAVTQKEQFKGEENQVLNGASLSLSNQKVLTVQGGKAPGLQSVPCTLVPGNQRTLLIAQGSEGTGTWIYRFGDGEMAGKSVALDVSKGANPEATTYSSTLIWELGAVPGN
ncbi:WxL domain-containing protein [Enterococcus casseliflavus]|uniref:WxL domain-containing protein n=1 Tax=Enterococcus casseliflavus TaxID=37734 RepID=UPI00232AA8C7|nr:WxL domain-containing protein [Enterococcus casseliflavus]MDB1690139.1 WxL domain-containing protein [Enterococcus casseliflavus]